jgi:hypothetical protein
MIGTEKYLKQNKQKIPFKFQNPPPEFSGQADFLHSTCFVRVFPSLQGRIGENENKILKIIIITIYKMIFLCYS